MSVRAAKNFIQMCPLCRYFSKRTTPCYGLQRRRELAPAPNVISLKGPLCNLKQSHVLRRFFFENYFSGGTAPLRVLLLYFHLTYTNSNPTSKVSISRSVRIVAATKTFHTFHAFNGRDFYVSLFTFAPSKLWD